MKFQFGFILLSACVSIAFCQNSPVGARLEFAGPQELRIGTNFVAKCQVEIAPQGVPHNVTFYLNNQVLGHHVVKGNGQSSWETIQFIPGLNVFAGPDSSYPIYSALFEPQTVAAQGVYKCSVSLDAPGGKGRARYFSNDWDGLDVSGKKFIPPTATLAYRNAPAVKAVAVGEPFVGRCSLDMSLVKTNYKVRFIVDRWARAQYVVKANQPKPSVHWQVLLQPNQMNIFRGNDTTYPDFTVQFVPVGPVQGNTQFQCDLELEIPNGGGNARYYSNRACTSVSEEQCNTLP